MTSILSKSGAALLLAALSTASLSFAQPGPGFDPNAPGVPGIPGRRVVPGGPGGPGGPVAPIAPGIPGRRFPGLQVPPVPVPPPRGPVVVESDDTAITAQVQRKLKKLGYYEGIVDGAMGRGTRGAIRSFQSENGLAETGAIDRPLLRALGLL